MTTMFVALSPTATSLAASTVAKKLRATGVEPLRSPRGARVKCACLWRTEGPLEAAPDAANRIDRSRRR
jgi:hypothetical protein